MTQNIFVLDSYYACSVDCPVRYNDQFITTEEGVEAFLDEFAKKEGFAISGDRENWKQDISRTVNHFTLFQLNFQEYIQQNLKKAQHSIGEIQGSPHHALITKLKSIDFLFYLEFIDFDTRVQVRTKQHFIGSIEDFLAKNFEPLDLFNPKHRVGQIKMYGASCSFSHDELETKFDCTEQCLTHEAFQDGYRFGDNSNQKGAQ
jgi:hypothetical protein